MRRRQHAAAQNVDQNGKSGGFFTALPKVPNAGGGGLGSGLGNGGAVVGEDDDQLDFDRFDPKVPLVLMFKNTVLFNSDCLAIVPDYRSFFDKAIRKKWDRCRYKLEDSA